jgi:hypothetical protein
LPSNILARDFSWSKLIALLAIGFLLKEIRNYSNGPIRSQSRLHESYHEKEREENQTIES